MEQVGAVRLEVYFLPNGGMWGKDELPLHSSLTNFSMQRDTAIADVALASDDYRSHIPVSSSATLAIQSYGLKRDIPKFIETGGRGTVALLYGNRPMTICTDIVIASFNIQATDEAFQWNGKLHTSAPIFSGNYVVDMLYARAQYDQADGTFLEKALTRRILLDDLIDNRYHGRTA